jgi:rhamnosyltransferase
VHASVVIRAKDEAGSIGRALALLARQTLPHEVIVVDSGSRDATPAIARERGAHVIEIPAADFTFGGALNTGAAVAAAPVVVALSAHAFPRDDEWLERVVAHFADAQVACVYGETLDDRFRPLAGPVRQDAAMLARNPFWGYSNAAGAFRAARWRERPFREDMPGTEDREWSHWALSLGDVCVLDPALAVDHDHSRDPLHDCFRRYAREHRGFAMFVDLPRYGLADLGREWWGEQGGHRSLARARLDPRRAARLAGKWWGRRAR